MDLGWDIEPGPDDERNSEIQMKIILVLFAIGAIAFIAALFIR